MALLIVSSVPRRTTRSRTGCCSSPRRASAPGSASRVPTLNTFAAAFHPAAVDRAILVLNALLGLGTVLAPVFVAIFVGLGFWWGLPLTSAILLAALVARQPAAAAAGRDGRRGGGAAGDRDSRSLLGLRGLRRALRHLRDRQRQLVAAGHDRRARRVDHRGGPGAHRVLGRWSRVGRVLFAAIQRRFPSRLTFHLLPFVLAGAFVIIAVLPDDEPALGVLAFGLAGLGCSALLPLTISFGQEELTAFSAATAGGVIAFYQLGYGIAAFGVGPLLDGGVGLPTIYAFAAVDRRGLGAWSFAVAAAGRPASDLGHRPPTFIPSGCQLDDGVQLAARCTTEKDRERHRASSSRSRSATSASRRGGRRRAALVLGRRPGAARRLRAGRAGPSGRGQVLMPWPNRLEDGAYEFDGRTPPAPADGAGAAQRDPRPRPRGALDGR